jgi:hypothetical protein
MYPNYLKGLEGYSKVEVSLYKLIKDNSKTKINLLQPKKNYIKGLSQLIDTVVGPKYILLMPLGIFIKHLYII